MNNHLNLFYDGDHERVDGGRADLFGQFVGVMMDANFDREETIGLIRPFSMDTAEYLAGEE